MESNSVQSHDYLTKAKNDTTKSFKAYDNDTISENKRVNGSYSASDIISPQNENQTSSTEISKQEDDISSSSSPHPPERPIATDAGGYTHTSASRAKISAANKGKTPWNKGKARSEETKARIAEGVRRKNRERFLLKLKDLGMTEEEYEANKKEERRKKDAERRARRTENGGYRPTEETKAKISKILKEKFANGEIKKKKRSGPYRKGFKHSEETKEKIRASLKKKWAEDVEYKEKMKSSYTKSSTNSVRQKIANTLKEKWKDPKFKAYMMEKMKSRKKTNGISHDRDRREKISEAMKKKWQDLEYRRKAIQAMEKRRDELPKRPQAPRSRTKTASSSIKSKTGKVTNTMSGVTAVQPVKVKKRKMRTGKKSSRNTTAVSVNGTDASPTKTKKKRSKKMKKSSTGAEVKLASELTKNQSKKAQPKDSHNEKKECGKDGDISRLREERRDLYDLLYGDEVELPINDNTNNDLNNEHLRVREAADTIDKSIDKSSFSSLLGSSYELDDIDLDD
eukprot:CAMPEP_0184865662 /NCGR_PEP_ID=MMETSP0580-20130426/18782_1 /TAXON_ID=1118495 /ORGANISM="Dactyliosolen fragilissimus" /LENGTH=510 /DNA_ID=CAMNT_0027364949 /DNA_START=586 /DNA_END=2115 /DNA_ORIENTATION=-